MNTESDLFTVKIAFPDDETKKLSWMWKHIYKDGFSWFAQWHLVSYVVVSLDFLRDKSGSCNGLNQMTC